MYSIISRARAYACSHAREARREIIPLSRSITHSCELTKYCLTCQI